MNIQLKVNGKPVALDVAPNTLLVQALRYNLNLTGTHVGCDTAQCGACTVLVDGKPVKSCNVLVVQVQGRYAVARHALRAGTVVQSDDVEWRDGDVARLGESLPEELRSLDGLELFRPVAAGAPLRLNDFRAVTVIRSGDLVSLSLKGQGFEMITTGYALADAAIGVTVRVRTLEGKILQGKAVSPGKVEAVLD